MLRLAAFFCTIFLCVATCPAQGGHAAPPAENVPKWKFAGVWGTFDRQAAQRGYQVYREVCSSCHSMKRIAFRNLRQIGFTAAEIKSIASSYSVMDGPDESGEMFERPGIASDYFPSPFANKEAAAAANNGANPPDLSLIVKARHKGATYIYSLLTGYSSAEPDENGLYENNTFPGGRIAMAPPLSEGVVAYMDDTPSTVENMARDVVNFLQWVAEPEMEDRKKLGMKIVSSLIAATILIVIVNMRLWSTLRK